MDNELRSEVTKVARNYNSMCNWAKVTVIGSLLLTGAFMVYAFWDSISTKFTDLRNYIDYKFKGFDN